MTSASSSEPNLDLLIDEVLRLRPGMTLPKVDEGPVEVIDRLSDVRTRLDRVEEVLSVLVRYRGRVRSGHKAATASVDEAWASKVSTTTRRPRGGSDGWGEPAPRERYAEADLATLDQKREQRRLERLLDAANDAVDVVQRAHRGLDSVRMDLHLILRAMSVEASLER